ncbi:helix-turn-helix domain-containing protein [Aestuariivirga litoralis]|uniref:helix-turn-helix domain-containing protein n=1 Tax=Aestuariivirga litoralis TaxID=2650924 RepID=UPI0018C4C91B|nr:LexA family transcriptional regulator [Aestuariivirga litoralis]MBG1232996.1 helix-turn-helix domain-containing protein [Aestuariivirga litoralis]
MTELHPLRPDVCQIGKFKSMHFCQMDSGKLRQIGKVIDMSAENNIREIRDSRKLTLEVLAERTGLSVGYLSRLEKGARNLSLKNMQLIADSMQVQPHELLPLQTSHHRIPLVGEVQAGKWRATDEPWEDPEVFDIPLPEPYKGLRPFALRVLGPSMNSIYPEGSILICCHVEELQEDPIPGKRYIIEDCDEADGIETTVKEFVVDAEGRPWAWPRSTHPEFQSPMPLDIGRPGHTIRIKARVIFSLKGE